MRSSTSNSDRDDSAQGVDGQGVDAQGVDAQGVDGCLHPAHRAPHAPWNVILLVAIAGTSLLLVGVNRFWIARGHLPSVSDSMGLWTAQRRQLRDDEPQWALVGTSRMKLGFSERVFRDRFSKDDVRMLAIAGTYPLAALRDLGLDESFHGTVLLDATVDSLRVARIEDQQPYVDHARNALPHQLIDPLVRGQLQARYPVFQSHLSLVRVTESLYDTAELPPLVPVVSGTSRFSVGFLRQDSTDATAAPASVQDALNQDKVSRESEQLIREANKKIVDRGGRVVLVHFPTTIVDQPAAQRDAHKTQWLRMAQRTGVPAIYFGDLPGVGDLRCVDGQHLNGDDAARFTAALLDAVEEL